MAEEKITTLFPSGFTVEELQKLDQNLKSSFPLASSLSQTLHYAQAVVSELLLIRKREEVHLQNANNQSQIIKGHEEKIAKTSLELEGFKASAKRHEDNHNAALQEINKLKEQIKELESKIKPE